MNTSPTRIKIYNSLSMQKEPLVPLRSDEVRLYVCGPTVYNLIHIGNARTFTIFDVVVRYLRHRGLKVVYVRNFTDVDDRIIQAAQKTGEAAVAVSKRFIDEFHRDSTALHLLEPDVAPKVSEHMGDIIRIIQTLMDRQVAYESAGDVYFSIHRYPPYTRLSRRNLDDLRAGERVQPGEQKREPLDFALWKAAKPGEPAWDSPWGQGRPGWHIECSAMAARYLGESFDIHGGGRDLIFPHHENEMAQSEAAFQKPFARYWMHCGFLELEGAKMSKSLGNMFMLRQALEQVDADALRLFFLSTHYRHPLSFGEKSLLDAESRMEYFYETLHKVDARLAGRDFGAGSPHESSLSHFDSFEKAMDDDFNVPGASAAVSAIFASMNEWVDKPLVKDTSTVGRTLLALRQQVRLIGGILGILEDSPEDWLSRRRERAIRQRGIDREKLQFLLEGRTRARGEKDFNAADRIRGELKQMGVEVMDTPGGTTWKVLA